MTIVFGTVLPWLLLAAATSLGYQFVRQNEELWSAATRRRFQTLGTMSTA